MYPKLKFPNTFMCIPGQCSCFLNSMAMNLMTQWLIAPALKTLLQSWSEWGDVCWKECVLAGCLRLITGPQQVLRHRDSSLGHSDQPSLPDLPRRQVTQVMQRHSYGNRFYWVCYSVRLYRGQQCPCMLRGAECGCHSVLGFLLSMLISPWVQSSRTSKKRSHWNGCAAPDLAQKL